MARFRRLAVPRLRLPLADVLLAAGVAGVGAGVALVYLPAGLIAVGALLLAGGLRLAAGPDRQ